MRTLRNALLAGTLLALVATPAKATLVVEGIGYDVLFGSVVGDTVLNLTLHITGINGPADTRGGRASVESFAFNHPAGFVTAAAAGYVFEDGGLNANGCNGSGNFFCFNGPGGTAPPLPVNSILDIPFSLTVLSIAALTDNYAPSFKINWEGSAHNYDLVSQNIGQIPTVNPTVSVPGPLVGAGLPGLISLLGLLWYARRRGSIFC